MDDRGLNRALEEARSGDHHAWERLYDWLAPGVLGYLRARGAAEPDDVLGEVFLQSVRDLPRFKGEARDFRAWVFSIAHHRLIDEARHRSRRPAAPTDPDEIVRHAGSGDAEEEALDRLGAEEIVARLAHLSEAQRSVILLRVLGDLSIEETARVIGRRPGAVKQLQHRATARLRKELRADP